MYLRPRPNYLLGLKYATGLLLLFLFIDYVEEYPLHCQQSFDTLTGICQKLWRINKWPSLVLAIYAYTIWLLYIHLKDVEAVFIEFIVPLAIVLFTLVSGTIGFFAD
jgi:hypothetical protein